uniref:Uncharacterized protein n=1 Tax=Timema tahoe TaxID=61484 RepID=A0A7R9IIW0_9NEOP|nr:unnamed protein product [Timema tahoe]
MGYTQCSSQKKHDRCQQKLTTPTQPTTSSHRGNYPAPPQVYVLPSTSQIPISSTVAAKIRDIAKEEKQKFTGVKEFLKTCLGISNRRQNETCAEADTQKGVAQVQTEEVTQVNKTCQTVDTQNYDTEELTTIQLPATNFALNTELSCSIETQTNKLEESLCSSQTTGEGSVSRTLINEPSILTSEIFDIGTMFNNLEGLAEPINNDIMSCEFCFRDKDSLTEHSVPILLVNNDILDTSQESVIGSQLESDNEGMDVSAQSQGSIVPNDANMQFISVSGAHNTSFTEPVTDKNTMSPPTITDWRSKPSCEMARSGVLPCKLYSMQVPANMCAKEHSDKKTGIDHCIIRIPLLFIKCCEKLYLLLYAFKSVISTLLTHTYTKVSSVPMSFWQFGVW